MHTFLCKAVYMHIHTSPAQSSLCTYDSFLLLVPCAVNQDKSVLKIVFIINSLYLAEMYIFIVLIYYQYLSILKV